MKTEDVFPSRFLKAEMLEHDVNVTIDHVILEAVYDAQAKEEVKKPVCYFQGKTRGLLLNKTNWSTLADLYGDESDTWAGRPIGLTVVEVSAFGEVTKAIRTMAPKAKPA